MTKRLTPIPLNTPEAIAWFRRSLAQGAELSAKVLEAVALEDGNILALAPSPFAYHGAPNFAEGGVASINAANQALDEQIGLLVARGASCLLIEDDVARRGDPAIQRLKQPSAFVRDRVIHWVDLRSYSSAQAVEAMRRGSTGYPTNAFVTTATVSQLALIPSADIRASTAALLVDSLVAIIVSVFDGESFLIWESFTETAIEFT